jgi:aspartate kinase
MALIVQKYGGSSVGTIERIENVAARVIAAKQAGHDVVVVVSAMYGETDRLIQLSQAITDEPEPREYDMLVATGEQVSMALLAIALAKQGTRARSYTGLQAGVMTDSAHTRARILDVKTDTIRRDLANGFVVVVAGFQGSNPQGEITTLGRGGSDTSMAFSRLTRACCPKRNCCRKSVLKKC